MRAFGFTLAGLVIGILAGYAVMFLAMYVVAPLFISSNEMSQGLIGTFVAVVAIPVLAVVGGITGFKRSRR